MKARLSTLATLAAIVVSCTFPSVTYNDASVPVDATVEAGDEADVDASDGGEAGDAGDEVDPCDEDNDQYKSLACDGSDCNDHDPRVNPGQGFLPDVPDAAPSRAIGTATAWRRRSTRTSAVC